MIDVHSWTCTTVEISDFDGSDNKLMIDVLSWSLKRSKKMNFYESRRLFMMIDDRGSFMDIVADGNF